MRRGQRYWDADGLVEWQPAHGAPATQQPQFGNNGGFANGNGFGRGYNPNRAFFTREYADLLDKIKFKEVVEETSKKQQLGITEVTGPPRKVKVKKVEGAKKGKQAVDEKEEAMNDLHIRKLSQYPIREDRLSGPEVEDKRNGAKELKRLRAEQELREMKENANMEKRKRGGTKPGTSARSEKVPVKLAVKIKSPQPRRIFVVSDDEGGGTATTPSVSYATQSNLKVRFDQEEEKKDNGMEELKVLLKELIIVVSTKETVKDEQEKENWRRLSPHSMKATPGLEKIPKKNVMSLDSLLT
ncbi:hypothetical protein CBR_g52631 [Chara braunii]|uniref:Uncharacterized protein n=1 Tax=Chara braunii TaxID=69332 RepID=A0A388MAQ7_CHABU|nr:hypothetical protein CBR_g52631 [Chara braunii]|eukprot:GBG91595.1 hypothetical protein CBR_g52631 [Chara braunii]